MDSRTSITHHSPVQKGCPIMAQTDPPSSETAKSIRPTNFRIIPRIPNPTSHFMLECNSLKFHEGGHAAYFHEPHQLHPVDLQGFLVLKGSSPEGSFSFR